MCGGKLMGDIILFIFNCIGSALPLGILCLCLANVISNKTLSSKALIGYIIICIIMFFILLRT